MGGVEERAVRRQLSQCTLGALRADAERLVHGNINVVKRLWPGERIDVRYACKISSGGL